MTVVSFVVEFQCNMLFFLIRVVNIQEEYGKTVSKCIVAMILMVTITRLGFNEWLRVHCFIRVCGL